MNERILTKTLSDELSGDVAVAILTRAKELDRDPRELLEIVRTVHDTLQDLSIEESCSVCSKRARLEEVIAQSN
jgi:hypothetical protein